MCFYMQHMLNSLQQWIPSMRLLFKDSANYVLLCCSAEKSLYSLASIHECLKMLHGCCYDVPYVMNYTVYTESEQCDNTRLL